MSRAVFIFSYFKTTAESLHLAYSTDGLHWNAFNNNEPVLKSHIKTQTMRDPFIIRAKDGLFHLVWSDGSTSRFFGHAISKNLINWKDQTAVPIMAHDENCECVWAPEVFYDNEADNYRIIWSSLHSSSYLKLWSATTENFTSFSEPHVFFDPGYAVIDGTFARNADGTITKEKGGYYLIFKDEREQDTADQGVKQLRIATSGRFDGSFNDISDPISPRLVEGPSVLKIDDRWLLYYDYFMKKRYGISSSIDLRNWEISDDISFPDDCRHGTVFTISKKELSVIL